ncbi:MAG: hypothetical protein V4558_09045 [Gemmatimonadota bacterium]
MVAIAVWVRVPPSPGARSFAWWLVLGAASNVLAFLMGMHSINNHDLFHWYDLFSAMLLGLTGYLLLSDQRQRRAILVGMMVFAIFWALLTAGGDGLEFYSKYTSPGESFVGLSIGILLVAEAIRSSDDSPWSKPEAWLGFGLVLASAPALGTSPIVNALAQTSRSAAMMVYRVSQTFSYVALILWCIPYWKRSVTWGR